jgi:hypothetical protein
MAKFIFKVKTRMIGSDVKEEYEIPDDELEGLDTFGRNDVIQEHLEEWLWNDNIYTSWDEAEEDSK